MNRTVERLSLITQPLNPYIYTTYKNVPQTGYTKVLRNCESHSFWLRILYFTSKISSQGLDSRTVLQFGQVLCTINPSRCDLEATGQNFSYETSLLILM